MQRGKKYIESVKKVDKSLAYTLKDAISLVKEMKYVNFDSSLEGHFKIKYKSMQDVRGVVQFPNGTGRTVKVLVFAKGDKAQEAKDAGADYVGDEDLILKIKDGWVDFDFVVATPDMMKDVGKLGPILGRKGLMPKPKAGTVTQDVATIISQLKAGRVEYKADKTGVVHFAMGKLSFDADKLYENVLSAFSTVMKDKPSDAKGDYVVSFYIAGSQSPSVKIDTKSLR